MIKYLKADAVKHKSGALFSCCNCFCTMKSGIAAQISKDYPEAVAADNATLYGDVNKLGKFSKGLGKDGKWVYNLYGQYNYGTDGRKTNYEAIYVALESAAIDCLKNGIKSIAIPAFLASGLAGGSWLIIEAMIKEVFEGLPIEVYICSLK